MRVNELIAGTRGDLAVKLFGDDLEVLAEKGEEIERSLAKVKGAEETKVEVTTGLPQLQIKPDRAAMARYGLNVENVNELVESIFAGQKAGEVFEGEQRFDIVLRLNENSSKSVESVRALILTAPNGQRVPLAQVADIALVEGAAQISREATRRRIVVSTNVRDRDIASFRRRGKGKDRKRSEIAAWILSPMGRSVRKPRTCDQSPVDRRTDRVVPDLCNAVLDLRFGKAGPNDLHRDSVRDCWRRGCTRTSRNAVLDLSGCRIYRLIWRCGIERRRDDKFYQSSTRRRKIRDRSR